MKRRSVTVFLPSRTTGHAGWKWVGARNDFPRMARAEKNRLISARPAEEEDLQDGQGPGNRRVVGPGELLNP